MFKPMMTAGLLGLSLFAATISCAQSFALPQHGVLHLEVPAGWQAKLQPPPEKFPPTIRLSSESALLLITPLWDPNGGKLDLNDAKIRQAVEEFGARMLPAAAETTLNISKIQGQFIKGYYATFTDKAPKPGGFKYATTGAVALNDLLVSATYLSNTRDMTAFAAILGSASETHE